MGFDSDVSAVMGAALLTFFYVASLVFFGHRMSRGPVYRWLLLAFTLGMIAAGLAVTQWIAFRTVQSRLESTSEDVRKGLEMSELTAARLPEFRREVERKEATLEAVRRALPETLDVADYLAEVGGLAAERSVRIVATRTDSLSVDFYEEAAAKLVLDGDPAAIARLREDVLALSRLSRWSNDAEGVVTLTVFAMKASRVGFVDRCDVEDDHAFDALWFPPYTDTIEAGRDDWVRLCERYARLMPIHLQVHAYQELLTDLENREALIARFR